ncbi:MAG: hypothetical protein ACFFC7_31170 [Candidatus Hermodarchaeota archaeon]
MRSIGFHLEFLEKNADKFTTFSWWSLWDTSCDEVLEVRWIKAGASAEDISNFRKEMFLELSPILNALVRAAVEKYIRRRGMTIEDFCNTYRPVFSRFDMFFDEDHSFEENLSSSNFDFESEYNRTRRFRLDALDINRFLRNEYLHSERQPNPITATTNKSVSELLTQRVNIFVDTNKITFLNTHKVVCKLLDAETQILQNYQKNLFCMTYAEFLMWRVKNIVKEIDSVIENNP